MPRPHTLFGTKRRGSNPFSTQYLKEQCILPVSTPTTPAGKIVLAGTGGVITPYTVGYCCLALNYKNGAGERDMSRDILDIFAQFGTIQDVIMTNFGSDYEAGDSLELVTGDDDGKPIGGAFVTVDSVNDDGEIIDWHLSTSSDGYPPNIICSVDGGAGTGAAFQVVSDMMQHVNGWWYDAYNPYLNPDGYAFNPITVDPAGRTGNLRVDSDAALLIWAMSDYDDLTSGTRYVQTVRRAIAWLRRLQESHFAAHGTHLVSNLVYENVDDTTALTADCAEVLMCVTRAMDAYGDTLTDSDGSSVKDMANNLYAALTATAPDGTWGGESNQLYKTSFPIGQNDAPPFSFNYQEPISFTQSLTAWANKMFVQSGYLVGDDHSDQCEKAIDYTWTKMSGQWGGQFYTPFNPKNRGTDRIEHLEYTAEMVIAMREVNPTKYEKPIATMIDSMRRACLPNGMAWGQTHENGELWRGLLTQPNVRPKVEAYAFLVLDLAGALLADA